MRSTSLRFGSVLITWPRPAKTCTSVISWVSLDLRSFLNYRSCIYRRSAFVEILVSRCSVGVIILSNGEGEIYRQFDYSTRSVCGYAQNWWGVIMILEQFKNDLIKMPKISRIELWKSTNNKKDMVVKSYPLKHF